MASARTFLWWNADEWAAAGVWFTGLATVALVFLAVRQISGAARLNRENIAHERQLLREQSRPFVLVDAHFRSYLIQIAVRNTGRTAAHDVAVRFDDRVESCRELNVDWQDTTLFRGSVPMIAPGRELLFNLDVYFSRAASDLPMELSGTTAYRTGDGEDHFDERFVIDLGSYEGSALPDKTMHDLIEELEKLRKEHQKWTNGLRGLDVRVTDAVKARRKEDRPFHLRSALKKRDEDGWRSFCVYFVHLWRRRHGWYSR